VRGAAQKSAARMKMPATSFWSPALLSTMRAKKTKYDISPPLKGSFDSLSVECVFVCVQFSFALACLDGSKKLFPPIKVISQQQMI